MSRNSTLILLGILIILVPFLGLPIAMWKLLEAIFGACVFGIGLSLRVRVAREAQAPAETPALESTPPGISPI